MPGPGDSRLHEEGRGEHEGEGHTADDCDGEEVGADVAVVFADMVARGRVVTAGACLVGSLDLGIVLARITGGFPAFGTREGGGGDDAAAWAARLSSGHTAMLFRGG